MFSFSAEPLRLALQNLGRYEEARGRFSKALAMTLTPAQEAQALRSMAMSYAFESNCRGAVPYYAELLEAAGEMGDADPREYLRRLPVLTKEKIRSRQKDLESRDLARRRWSYNTSGGSTGEPVRLVQDREYEDRSKGISLLFFSLIGCDVGQPMVRLWGSERDIEGGADSRRAQFFNWLTSTTWLNAFRMSPQRMRQYVEVLNRTRASHIGSAELSRPVTKPCVTSKARLRDFIAASVDTLARVSLAAIG